MLVLQTTYPLPDGGRSCTEVAVRSVDEIEGVLAARGMEEEIGFAHERDARALLPSEWLRAECYAEAAHAVVWLGSIACKAGLADGWDLLNDRGLVHRVVHLASGVAPQEPEALERVRERLIADLEAFEDSVPGIVVGRHVVDDAAVAQINDAVTARAQAVVS